MYSHHEKSYSRVHEPTRQRSNSKKKLLADTSQDLHRNRETTDEFLRHTGDGFGPGSSARRMPKRKLSRSLLKDREEVLPPRRRNSRSNAENAENRAFSNRWESEDRAKAGRVRTSNDFIFGSNRDRGRDSSSGRAGGSPGHDSRTGVRSPSNSYRKKNLPRNSSSNKRGGI